ncbi:MAG: extracellular solute-binding protein, partial [Actinomycetota bacterium]|nr:extracellular solute-binding protein [Actinomycetota bacterium]
AALVTMALIAACAGGAGEQPHQRAKGAATTVLQVLLADDWVTVDAVIHAVRTFERDHPGVRVQISGAQFSHIPDMALTGGRAGDPVDVAQWHAFAAGARGLAEPLDDLWQGQLSAEEFFPGAVDDVTWAGSRYGVPLDTNVLLLMANSRLLVERKVKLPEGTYTFADFERVARAVTSGGGDLRGIALPTSTWVAYGWIRANGGEIVEVNGTEVRFTLDAPQVVEALGFLGHLIDEGLAFPPVIASSSEDAYSLFQAGRTALHLSGMWALVGQEPAGVGRVVLPLPQGARGTTRGTVLGGSSLYVPRGSPNRELAFEFMLHLASDRYALWLAEEEGRLPTRPRTFDAFVAQRPAFATALEQLRWAGVMRLIAFPEAQAAFDKAVEDIFTGRVEAAVALARAQQAAQQSTGS